MKRYTRSPLLRFGSDQEDLTESLSAAVFVGDQLWLASDELKSVERLSTDDGGLTFGGHESFKLKDFITLPADGTGSDPEVDVEGMDFDGSCLWLVGSHSFKRKKAESKKPEEHNDPAKMIAKLAKVDKEGNRFILARIPLVTGDDGRQSLAREATDAGGRQLRAAQLPCDLKSSALTKALGVDEDDDRRDPHLGKFLKIPGKDNGLDIEGLVVSREQDSEVYKIFLGLRGPVLRGWAVVLELSAEVGGDGALALKGIGPAGRPYKKHFLELRGLGVRELCADGSDILVLAGPSMNLDGPVGLYRWRGALAAAHESLVRADGLKRVLEIPHGDGEDHAEGVTFVPGVEAPKQLLVLYDSPAAARREGRDAVRADVFDLPTAT
jgi:hypothetical protein